ncbi:MAG: leucine-rich repeat protein, partial [Clostridia bacterium]|nr:leucine-rich repeat protein [Clostridia bacterium]
MRKILSVIVALTMLVCLLPSVAFPATALTEGYYTYTVSDGQATITDVNTSISGAITIPATLGGYPVTSIGNMAFVLRRDLTSITIPDSVTNIGKSAFYGCTGLTSIMVDENNAVYHSENNCLIQTANKILVAGCKTSVIPD